MSQADQQLHREILTYIYEEQDGDLRRHAHAPNMVDAFEGLDRKEFRYHLSRLVDHRLIERPAQNVIKITVDGVEKLDQEGYDTLLASDLRYEILRIAYEIDRGATNVYFNLDDILEEIDAPDEDVQPHLWYLAEKGLLEITGTGPHYQLTGEGRNRYEEYRDEGLPIPRTDQLQRFTQHTIAQGDQEKAENVFRDIVEVAQEEIIVIDAYAKERLYRLLDHVPDVVDVKILTTEREVEEENVDHYRTYADGRRGDVELRYLDYQDEYPFHTREIIRDREAGWIWDHTFADAGDRHHTISQLRPVNLENDLEVYDDVWGRAQVVE